MSYRIEYQTPADRSYIRLPVLTAMCLILFLILVYWCWPEGSALIRKAVLASEQSTGVVALDRAAEAFGSGENAVQTFTEFLRNLQQ